VKSTPADLSRTMFNTNSASLLAIDCSLPLSSVQVQVPGRRSPSPCVMRLIGCVYCGTPLWTA